MTDVHSVANPECTDEACLSELAAQRNANAFFEKFSRSELQELLAVTSSSWLITKDYTRGSVHVSTGLTGQLMNISDQEIVVLAPVDPDASLDCREVHQILRELTVGIFCCHQIPSICLEANYDRSTSCELPPAYYDTRVGQILINVDYMLKALWHGAYMPREKRIRFSEIWRSTMQIDDNGIPQAKNKMFEEFSSAGLVDISTEEEFESMFDEDLNEDPTYQPNLPEEKHLFMHHVDQLTIKMTCYTTEVQQFDNLFVFAGSYVLSHVIKRTEEQLDSVTYQKLQQRLALHQRTIGEFIERRAKIREHIAYMNLISFLVPLLVALKKQMKIPVLDRLLQPFSEDKVKTERELPPLMLGPDFRCPHFEYPPDEYFHLHGGIEIDIGTPSLEEVSEEIKAAHHDLQNEATEHVKELLKLDATYREHYPIPVREFDGQSYYVISFEIENFYKSPKKTQWWEAINGTINDLKAKRLPLKENQLYEQFKQRFGYQKAIKCKNFHYGLKSASIRGLAAIFYTCSRKAPPPSLAFADDHGYALIHHAAIHNHVTIIAQLAMAGLNLNQRRGDRYLPEGKHSPNDSETLVTKVGPTALHLAAQCGSLEVISCLLTLKADFTLSDKRGWMPIHYASFYNNIPAIRALLRREPALLEMETTAEYQTTPLLLAATSGALDAFCYFLSIGADWKKVDSFGNNIVHVAVLYFHTDVLEHIIQIDMPEFPVWEIILGMLKSKESTRKEMAARCLEVFCISKDTCWEHVLEAGIVPSLVELLRSKRGKLESVALGVLSNISKHEPVARALVVSGAIRELINLLETSSLPDHHSRASVILSDIAAMEGLQDIIAEQGAIEPLVNLLHLDVEDVLVSVINCIQAMCKHNTSIQKGFMDKGALPILVEFLNSKSDALLGASASALAELARGNKVVQDAIVAENAINSLVSIISGRLINIQIKAALTIEALSENNAVIQKQFLDRSVAPHILKLLKVFQLEVREQGAAALWALAGQSITQKKAMAELITYSYIIDLLLSTSDKMQYVGGQAVIALTKDSNHYQNEICKGSGVGPLVRLLRSSKVSESTLLSVIRALGTMCIGVAHKNNPISQEHIVEELALPSLVNLLKTHTSLQIKVEAAVTLACIVLRNTRLQSQLKEVGFNYGDVLQLLHAPDKNIRLQAGHALALFAFSNTMQQFLLLQTGGIEMYIFEPFLYSEIETDRAKAAFQVVVLARVIVDVDQVALTARGMTILVNLLQSKEVDTLVLAGEFIASLTHTRAGIQDAFTTLGTIGSLVPHLYAEEKEVRVACANALGYLTFNRTAHRHLLVECRNTPRLFDLFMRNLSKDARISKGFIDDFKRQKQVGLPSLSLEKNGGPPAVPLPSKVPRDQKTCSIDVKID